MEAVWNYNTRNRQRELTATTKLNKTMQLKMINWTFQNAR